MNEILNIYRQWPFYGYRRIHVILREKGFVINHKRVQRLLTAAGLKAIYLAKNTLLRNQKHKVFDYLLKKDEINLPNKAWQVDITYIKLRTGFVCLICLIDIFSRRIMGWTLSVFFEHRSMYRSA